VYVHGRLEAFAVYVHGGCVPRMAQEHLTVKEIARLAGVSIGTVDRVLHDRGSVSADTRARIEEIVAARSYRPNLLARHLSLNRSYLLRVILPRADQDSGYWGVCRKGIEAAMEELAAYRVSVRIDEFDRYDREGFQALLEFLATEPGDGLLVAPVLPDQLRPALERLDPELPYVFFDGSIEGARPVVSIGQDALRAGHLAGRLMSLLSPQGRPLVAVNAHAEDRHIGLRIDGFRSFFSDTSPERQILVRSCFDIERGESCERFLSGLFSECPDLGGILVANASGHLVGRWLVRRGTKVGCAVVCWDLVPPNAEALRSGAVDCLLSQRPYEQGRRGLERLFKAVVHGEWSEEDEEEETAPLDVYFEENLPPRGAGVEARKETR
jgi:LacI family transcriptional regulator